MNFFDVNHYFHSELALGALANEAKKTLAEMVAWGRRDEMCGIVRRNQKANGQVIVTGSAEVAGKTTFVRCSLHARFWWRLFGLQLLEASHFRLGFLELTLLAVNLAEKVVCGGPIRVNRKGGFQFFLRLRKAIQIHQSFAECFVRTNVARSDRHCLLENR